MPARSPKTMGNRTPPKFGLGSPATVPPAGAMDTPSRGPWRMLSHGPIGPGESLLVALLIALGVIFTATDSSFLTSSNLSSTAQDATETLVLAVGETFVIIAAGIDLSVGAVLGLSGVVAGLVMQHVGGLGSGGQIAIGVAVALGVGALAGLINGCMIVFLRISPFIATLAMLGVAGGLTLVLTKGVDVSSLPPVAVTIGNETLIAGVTYPILTAAVIAIVGGLYLHHSRFGRWTYAVGSDRRSARLAGIPINTHLLRVYLLSGLLAGVAGFTVLMRLGVASPQSGVNDELNAIAAVVIGGASLYGGMGTMLGSVLGALVLSVILNGLILSGVQPYWQQIATGILIAAAVGFQSLTRPAQEDI